MAKDKRVVWVPPGGKNFVHVADAAKCIVNTLTLGQHGEKYILAGENLSYHQFYTKLHNITGTKQRLITVPKYLLYSIGAIGSMLRLMGVKTPLSLTNMRILCTNNYYSNAKAVQNLNLQPTAIDEAILDAVQWFEKKSTKFYFLIGV